MSEVAIRVEALGKRYRIGASQAPYRTLRETLVELAAAPARRVSGILRGHLSPPADNTIWALRDVSFEVKRGEALGIIGRNGAGKSTLLKILSRITKPTEGRVNLLGRVGSLLEVGTGFHPELTGRENIFLNGAILGMRRAEIELKFDEIVAFAEIVKFLDTPIKHYSSGMYVRLAFAVAAHLEPEILLVDEVLAVGDSAFQKKCLGKMKDVAESGRTVLFVSHSLGAINQLCSDCLWIEHGTVAERGAPVEVVARYLGSGGPKSLDGAIAAASHMHEPRGLRFTRALLLGRDGQPVSRIACGEPLRIECEFEVEGTIRAARLGIAVQSTAGTLISAFHQTDDPRMDVLFLRPGRYLARMTTELALAPGSYAVGLVAKPDPGFWGSGEYSLDWVLAAASFFVEAVSTNGEAVLPTGALVRSHSAWSFEELG